MDDAGKSSNREMLGYANGNDMQPKMKFYCRNKFKACKGKEAFKKGSATSWLKWVIVTGESNIFIKLLAELFETWCFSFVLCNVLDLNENS